MSCDLLVGSTGFVGGNLAAKHTFTAACHSSDIAAQYGTRPDLCVYAGVPAAMFLANADPEADLAVMRAARENIRRIAPQQLVLISSIAVLADSRGVYEDSPAQPAENLPAYGKNRLQLEQWVREDFPDALIVRLPALYGIGIKKNFLFDLHTITPAMLKPEKYDELAAKSPLVQSAYTLADNGFYKLNGTADAFALVKRLDNPGLSVNLDLSTVLAQGEHLQSFIDDMQYVSHVHISEPGLVPIERRPEHKELALLLGAVGYRGFVSVEMAHTDVDTIRRTMDYIAEVFA